jgi:hypothetical protein
MQRGLIAMKWQSTIPKKNLKQNNCHLPQIG